jgi:hypothetical protein
LIRVVNAAPCALLSDLLDFEISRESNELGDLDHNLAKVEAASSSLVSRSSFYNPGRPGVCFFDFRLGGRVVMQRPAKPRTAVRFRS